MIKPTKNTRTRAFEAATGGGTSLQFIDWILARWREWAKETDKYWPYSNHDHAAFDTWLVNKFLIDRK